jgi:hypothetical protein
MSEAEGIRLRRGSRAKVIIEKSSLPRYGGEIPDPFVGYLFSASSRAATNGGRSSSTVFQRISRLMSK